MLLFPIFEPNVIEVYNDFKVIEADITGYSEFDSCHYKNCIMASGKRAYIGAIACPRDIKLSTRVSIDGKVYICEDRTSKVYNGRFDIFFGYGKESFEDAKNFGIKTVQVLIYEEGL